MRTNQNAINDDDVIRLVKEGNNDHQIAAKLNVSHDRVYRTRRKLENRGKLEHYQHTAQAPILIKDKAIDAVYVLINAANQSAILDNENRELHRKLGVLNEQLGALQRKYDELNRRYHALILERQNNPTEVH